MLCVVVQKEIWQLMYSKGRASYLVLKIYEQLAFFWWLKRCYKHIKYKMLPWVTRPAHAHK